MITVLNRLADIALEYHSAIERRRRYNEHKCMRLARRELRVARHWFELEEHMKALDAIQTAEHLRADARWYRRGMLS